MALVAGPLTIKIPSLQIDGTTQKVLLSRFQVEAFPSLFHLAGPEMREYLEPRTLNKVSERRHTHQHHARTGSLLLVRSQCQASGSGCTLAWIQILLLPRMHFRCPYD